MVYLSLKVSKVQAFIFKLPKLKTMLGANSLLGEFFVTHLPVLREDYSIPTEWRDYLSSVSVEDKWENDDLPGNFGKGIITSAGGHFETLFDSKEDALTFSDEVQKKAAECIPGVVITFGIFQNNYTPQMSLDQFVKNGERVSHDQLKSIYIDNPYFYPSGEDGENPQILDGKGSDSLISKAIKVQGNKFYDKGTSDLLATFLNSYYKYEKFPFELEDLGKASVIPSNNKIALIAIDGNAMGNRFRKIQDEHKETPMFESFIAFEKFWFARRQAFRVALKEACDDIKKEKNHTINFQILMLGGDDLLLLTTPEVAFKFVHKFSETLVGTTISAGIAITKYSYPFSQAHQLAESLLSSAKVKSRIWNKDETTSYRNAIDWHVHFPSGTEDIDEIRKQNYVLQYNGKTELLTQRPCTVNEAIGVWEEAKELHDNINNDDSDSKTGRNKFKGLRTLLKTGKDNVELHSKLLKIPDRYYHYDDIDENVHLNTALDVIELMDFHKTKDGGKNEVS